MLFGIDKCRLVKSHAISFILCLLPFFPAAELLSWLVAASVLSSELCAGRAGAGGLLCCCCTHHWALGLWGKQGSIWLLQSLLLHMNMSQSVCHVGIRNCCDRNVWKTDQRSFRLSDLTLYWADGACGQRFVLHLTVIVSTHIKQSIL